MVVVVEVVVVMVMVVVALIHFEVMSGTSEQSMLVAVYAVVVVGVRAAQLPNYPSYATPPSYSRPSSRQHTEYTTVSLSS